MRGATGGGGGDGDVELLREGGEDAGGGGGGNDSSACGMMKSTAGLPSEKDARREIWAAFLESVVL